MKRKVTLKIAKELDVSISTVSKSLEIARNWRDTRLKYRLLLNFTITDPTTLPKFKEQKTKSHRNNYTGDCSSFFFQSSMA
jgi:hypothetical protein